MNGVTDGDKGVSTKMVNGTGEAHTSHSASKGTIVLTIYEQLVVWLFPSLDNIFYFIPTDLMYSKEMRAIAYKYIL